MGFVFPDEVMTTDFTDDTDLLLGLIRVIGVIRGCLFPVRSHDHLQPDSEAAGRLSSVFFCVHLWFDLR